MARKQSDTPDMPLSEPMRRVMEALLEGNPPPAEYQAQLTEAEKQEIAALARTARLTALTLERPTPNPESEEKSLLRSRQILESQQSVLIAERTSKWRLWLQRFGVGRQGE
jgi:hypothetical protein